MTDIYRSLDVFQAIPGIALGVEVESVNLLCSYGTPIRMWGRRGRGRRKGEREREGTREVREQVYWGNVT